MAAQDNEATHDRQIDGTEQPLMSHLLELRLRLLYILAVVLALFVPLYFFANDLYLFVAEPLLVWLPVASSMIATEVASPFFTPFKLALIFSVFMAMPFVLYQAWRFIAPGLYMKEKRFVLPMLISSIVLFYGGIVFAYYAVMPLIFQFTTSVVPQGVAVMTDISKYLDFILKLFFAFGLAFEIPIVTMLLVRSGASTVPSLRRKRPFIVVGCFAFGMLLTPPDVISQVLLAVPMWLLYELGLILSIWITPKAPAEP